MTEVGVYVVTILEHSFGLCGDPLILLYDVPRMRINFESYAYWTVHHLDS